MGSTGEADRKRRHLSSISPTAAAAKKQPFVHLSEDKKLDTAVLQYQNQKLVQKLEVQKVECSSLETKFSQLKEKQKGYNVTLEVVDGAWVELIDGLGSCSVCTKGGSARNGQASKTKSATEDGVRSPPDSTFLSRLVETGATQSSCGSSSPIQNGVTETGVEKSKKILCKIVNAINDTWLLKDGLEAVTFKAFPKDGSHGHKMSVDLHEEVRNLRVALGDLHLTHKSLAKELQCHQDKDAKNKAEIKLLKAELESTISELEQSNRELATLKSERDAAVKGAYFPILNRSSKPHTVDRTKDKQKDLRDLESSLHELLGQASNRLLELKNIHEKRIGILKHLSELQSILKNVKGVTSSAACVLVREQLANSKAELIRYQTLYEKLQVEKDNLSWHEKEIDIKNDFLDVLQLDLSVAESRLTELGLEIQKQLSEKTLFEARLEAAAKEPGRKEVIKEFRALVSSFPDEMGRMQSQLSKYKEAAADVHSLRADVQSFSSILDRKTKELETLSAKSADQVAELSKLQAMVCDLKDSELELKLILEMYWRESTASRDVQEARESEYKTWAHVQSLNSSLDERNLEVRVKSAIEAEAISQQKLVAAEAEIADLRQKSEASRREKSVLSGQLKSKHEENEAYLSEIESIGQAYDDMQTQNQHLLQQITERDDYNIKLYLEGVHARQLKDVLFMENKTIEKAILQAKGSFDFCDKIAARIGDQLKICSDKSQRLAVDRLQNIATLENIHKKKLDVKKSCQHLRESLERSQSRVEKSRVGLVELQITLEKDRFEKKRLEEEVEVVRRKSSRLQSHIEGSSVVEKLQQELKEYKEILKCSVCLDRSKEVVITKCYHLFCNTCVQRILERRHRKCPVCAASFGPNDVKPVYI